METPAVRREFPFVLDLAGKPNSVVSDHLSGPVVANQLERRSFLRRHGLARRQGFNRCISYITVRLAPRLRSGRIFPFGKIRLCSHLAPYGVQALPATCLPSLTLGAVFGLSSRAKSP